MTAAGAALFTHTATIRGLPGIPVRKSGGCWWAPFQVALGVCWSSRDLEDLVELAVPIDGAEARTWRRDPVTRVYGPVAS
jgi:hypothetical protein